MYVSLAQNINIVIFGRTKSSDIEKPVFPILVRIWEITGNLTKTKNEGVISDPLIFGVPTRTYPTALLANTLYILA